MVITDPEGHWLEGIDFSVLPGNLTNRSGRQPVTVRVADSEKIEVCCQGRFGERISSSLFPTGSLAWVQGITPTPSWDQSTYRVGQTARLLLTLNPPEGQLILSVPSGRKVLRDCRKVKQVAEVFEIPILDAFITPSVVRLDWITSSEHQAWQIPIPVAADERRLKVTVRAQSPSDLVEPASVSVLVQNWLGEPCAGAEVILWVLDAAAEMACECGSFDIVEQMYPSAPAIFTFFGNGWINGVLEPLAAEARPAERLGVFPRPRPIQPSAVCHLAVATHLRTDDQGHASQIFALPSLRKRWSLRVCAAWNDHFGRAQVTFA